MTALAVRGHARQVQAVRRADAVGLRADRAVRRVWRELEAALQLPWHEARWQVAHLLRVLPLAVRHELAGGLHDLATWARRSTRWGLAQALGRKKLARAAYSLMEAADERGREDMPGVPDSLASGHPDGGIAGDPATGTGGVGAPSLSFSDLLDVLFPAPSPERVSAIVYATGWEQRIASGTGLAAPEAVAARVATGLMLGQDQGALVRELLPVVQGVASTARRLARTEGLRVCGQVQLDTHEALGDLVAGYRVRATLDQNTRPEHRARDGTVYWRHPRAGQKGMHEMPHPPVEADGRVAWNCRCWLEPVLGGQD